MNNRKRVGAIIQARMGSIRLPGKVLLKLPFNSDQTVLDNIVCRAHKIKNIDQVIVATSSSSKDDEIEEFCKARSINCFRGSENNVLSRYCDSAKEYGLDVVIRLTGDNPCIDSELISSVLNEHLKYKMDYTKTGGYPIGINVEIISFNALKKAVLLAKKDFELEHVTPFILNNSELFKIKINKAPMNLQKNLRLTLDTKQDYALFCIIFDLLYEKNNYFNLKNIMELFSFKPWLKIINEDVFQKSLFDSFDK